MRNLKYIEHLAHETKKQKVQYIYNINGTVDSCKSSHLLKAQHHGCLSAFCTNKTMEFIFFYSSMTNINTKNVILNSL